MTLRILYAIQAIIGFLFCAAVLGGMVLDLLGIHTLVPLYWQ